MAKPEWDDSEEWMTVAYNAGASPEEVADVLTLSRLLSKSCAVIKNVIVDSQIRARYGARAYMRRLTPDLKPQVIRRLASEEQQMLNSVDEKAIELTLDTTIGEVKENVEFGEGGEGDRTEGE